MEDDATATWKSDMDFLDDLCQLNDFTTNSVEVNENFALTEDTVPTRTSPSKLLSTKTPTNSTAAVQQKITYSIMSDMSKANIEFEPDYRKLLGSKQNAGPIRSPMSHFSRKDVSKDKLKLNGSPALARNDSLADYKPFALQQGEFPALNKK